jgi:hypothetical protein
VLKQVTGDTHANVQVKVKRKRTVEGETKEKGLGEPIYKENSDEQLTH